MNVLCFTTEYGNVKIELFDNPFVHMWTAHVQQMIKRYQYKPRRSMWPYVRDDKTGYKSIIDRLITIIKSINRLEFLAPLPETIDSNVLSRLDLETQQILNRLHRYCVTASNYRDRWINGQPSFDWVPYDLIEFNHVVNLLNQTIHEFEEYVETPRRRQYWCKLDTTEFILEASQYNDVDVYFDDVDQTIPEEMQQYLSIDNADVWIKKDILGKDFITAFVDHDNVHEQDVQPPPMFSGGFVIDYAGRGSLYNSPEFAQWLEQPVSAYHGNYAIGNVVYGKEHAKHAKTISNLYIGRS
jgi:hypothetical protein